MPPDPFRFPVIVAVLAMAGGCAMLGVYDVPVVDAHGSFDGRKVIDAVAVRDDEGLILIFTRLRFDRQQWQDDARLTPEDLGLFLRNDDDYAPRLELRLDASARLLGHRLRYGNHTADWHDASAHADALRITVHEADRLAGHLHLVTPRHEAHIDFDLPLLAFSPLPRSGTPLPADGGEPGRFLLEKSRATWGGDLDRMLALMTPRERSAALGSHDDDGMRGDLAMSGSSFFMLKQRMAIPYVERVTGGVQDGDTAWVDFAGSNGVIGHREVTGTVVLLRDRGGYWRVERVITADETEHDLDELEAGIGD